MGDNAKPKKLSPASQELLDAMRRGVKVHGMFGLNSYYFRADTFRRCSPQVRALLSSGAAIEQDRDWRGSRVIPAPAAASD